MHQHPAVHDAVVRSRVDELRHSAGASTYIRRGKRRFRVVAAARHGTGWLLVDMGLRLAMPRAGAKHSIAPVFHRRSPGA